MGKYQGYDKYKDSGVEWLGEIPEHWQCMTLKRHLLPQVGAIKTGPFGSQLLSSEMNDTEVKVYNQRNVLDQDFVGGTNYISEIKYQELKSFEVFPGDFLITTRGTIGKCAITPADCPKGILHPCLMRLQLNPKSLLDHFLMYLLQDGEVILEQLKIKSNATTIDVIYSDSLKSVFIPTPPLDEQEKIAQFLEYKTKKIDELIAKKETLIEKLDEKRTSLISHAVTKGLDVNVPMKDSGIEWLGEIPQHWEVIKIKHLTKILRGKFTHRPRNDPRFYDGEYPFIQTGDVANANKFIMEYTQTLNENGYGVSKEFPSGTLVMTIAANIGDMAILNFNACFPDSIVGFVPSNMTDIFFLYYLFSSMKKQFLSTAVLNTQLNLNVERISNIFTVIPPLNEQQKIAEYLDQKTAEIEEQKTKIQQAIDLLKEYRTALITNAVTGKIDVSQVDIP